MDVLVSSLELWELLNIKRNILMLKETIKAGQETVRAETRAKTFRIRIDHVGQVFSFFSIF